MGQLPGVEITEKPIEDFDEKYSTVSTTSSELNTIGKLRYLISSHIRQFEHSMDHIGFAPCLSYSQKVLKSVATELLPGPLTAHNSKRATTTSLNNKKKNSIAAITGLRGLACLIVFNGHLAREFGGAMFWQGQWNGRVLLFQQPFVHLFWSGRSMVYVFWVIGGYTLALKPLKQLRMGELQSFQQTWSSALVRRGFRLYLPPVFAVWIIGFLTWLGIFEAANAVKNDPKRGDYLHLMEDLPHRLSGLFAQMYDALRSSLEMFKIWRWNQSTTPGKYNDAYWTIPVQYRTALFMFLVLLAGSRMKPIYRTFLLAAVSGFGLFIWRQDELTTFFAGMLLADIDVRLSVALPTLPVQQDPKSQSQSQAQSSSLWRSSRLGYAFRVQHLYFCLFLLGWLMCSTGAMHFGQQPVIKQFIAIFPFLLRPGQFSDDSSAIRSLGAVFLVYGIMHCEYIRSLFTSRAAAYLGKLSFSLYLVHGVVLRSCLYPLMPHIYAVVGIPGPLSADDVSSSAFVIALFLGFIITFPLVIWAADVFYRLVEAKTSNLTMWIDDKISEKEA